jgi:hypothetical protein
MWAGIWIDGNLTDVAPYLRAVAQSTSPTPPPPAPTPVRIEAPRPCPVIGPTAKHTVAAAIAARSSGHCEIMAPDCRLGFEAIASRVPGMSWRELPDAAAGYAVCRTCQAAVAAMEPRLSRQLGYVVANPPHTSETPFYWRQKHWMSLDSAGGAAPPSSATRSA